MWYDVCHLLQPKGISQAASGSCTSTMSAKGVTADTFLWAEHDACPMAFDPPPFCSLQNVHRRRCGSQNPRWSTFCYTSANGVLRRKACSTKNFWLFWLMPIGNLEHQSSPWSQFLHVPRGYPAPSPWLSDPKRGGTTLLLSEPHRRIPVFRVKKYHT